MKATRNREIGGYNYRGYYFYKPEGCEDWNICRVSKDGMIDFCFSECSCINFKECKLNIDDILKEG